MKFKYDLFAIAAIAVTLAGCDISPQHEIALHNYSKAMCEGKLLSVDKWQFTSISGYTCITESGVEYREVDLNKIPVKYWDIPDE